MVHVKRTSATINIKYWDSQDFISDVKMEQNEYNGYIFYLSHASRGIMFQFFLRLLMTTNGIQGNNLVE